MYIYNAVYVQMVKTVQFEAVQERDPTNTDAVWTKYTIMVKGFLATNGSRFPGVETTTAVSATTLNQIKSQLETPRRPMLYGVGGVTLVTVPSGMDAKLGPEPLPCTVREMSAGTFYVECGCIVRLVECDNECEERNPVVSLRWTQAEKFDENWNSHITTMGKLIVRSDLMKSADSFRALTVPSILNNYIRKTSTYTLSPDGTILEFHFEDVEVDRMPPGVATKASGVYAVTMDVGGKREGTVTISLEGPKGTSRADLFNSALGYCYAKLTDDRIDTGTLGGLLIMGGEIKEDLFEPRVSVTMKARMVFDAGAGTGAVGFTSAGRPKAIPSIGGPTSLKVLENMPGLKPPDHKRLRGLLAAAFRDPCACLTPPKTLPTAATPPTFAAAPGIVDSVPSSYSPTSASVVGSSILIGVLSATGPGLAASIIKDKAPYDTYQIELSTRFTSGFVQMPGTGVGADANRSQIVKQSGEMMELTAVWVAGRSGRPPQLPTYFVQDRNLQPIDGQVITREVIPTADGALPMHLASGYYRYAVLDPSQYKITAGVPPYLSSQFTAAGANMMTGWTEEPISLVNSQAASGTNPFIRDGYISGINPQMPQGFQAQILPGSGQANFQQGGQQGGAGAGPFNSPPVGA